MTSADSAVPSFDPSFAEARGWSFWRLLAAFAVLLALLSACLTFAVLTGLTPIEPTPAIVYSFMLINVATILLLVGIIAREVWQVMQARRRGRAAARLHIQIVSLFSIIAVLPAIIVAVGVPALPIFVAVRTAEATWLALPPVARVQSRRQVQGAADPGAPVSREP